MSRFTGPVDQILNEIHRAMDAAIFKGYSDNHFKSGKVYHRDGTTTEWRNYAIVKTDEHEFKAPIIMEDI